MAVHQPEHDDYDRAFARHRDGVCVQNPLRSQVGGHFGAVPHRDAFEYRHQHEYLRGRLHHGGDFHCGGEREPYAAGPYDIFYYRGAVFFRKHPDSFRAVDGSELHRALHQRDFPGNRALDSLLPGERGGFPDQLRAGDDRGDLRQEPDECQSDRLSLPDGIHDDTGIREPVGGASQNFGIPVHRGHDRHGGTTGEWGEICDFHAGHGGAVGGACNQRAGVPDTL